MTEASKPQPASQGPHAGETTETPGHRHEHKEQIIEEGQDAQNDPRPTPEKLSGTPLGSDPRE